MIVVEGTIFAFGFLKKYNLSLLSMEGRVLDRCRAFDRLVSVDSHLCRTGDTVLVSKSREMTGGPKHCYGGWGEKRVKTTENKIHWPR
jgi:hypothetical protein